MGQKPNENSHHSKKSERRVKKHQNSVLSSPSGTAGKNLKSKRHYNLSSFKPISVDDESRWKSRVFPTFQPPSQQESEIQRDSRDLLLLLNKLTPTTFELHVSRFLEEKWRPILQNIGRLSAAINSILSRASQDVRYMPMFATLCWSLREDAIALGKRTIFDQVLLENCFKEEKQKLIGAEGVEKEQNWVCLSGDALARKCFVGHYRFLGELFAENVIELTTILRIIDSLNVESRPLSSYQQLKLEALCNLLQVAGKEIDSYSHENGVLFVFWDTLFHLLLPPHSSHPLLVISPPTSLCHRLKFMVMDLLDLRKNGWIPVRRGAKDKACLVAKTLNQIRYEAEMEDSHGGRTGDKGRSKRKKVKFLSLQ